MKFVTWMFEQRTWEPLHRVPAHPDGWRHRCLMCMESRLCQSLSKLPHAASRVWLARCGKITVCDAVHIIGSKGNAYMFLKRCGPSLLLIGQRKCSYFTLSATRVREVCHKGETSYCGLMNRDTLLLPGWWVPPFRSNMLPLSAGLKCSPGYYASVSGRV